MTQELPPLPTEPLDWEELARPPKAEPTMVQLSPRGQLVRAGSTHGVEELQGFLQLFDGEIRQAALHNPMVSEKFLC